MYREGTIVDPEAWRNFEALEPAVYAKGAYKFLSTLNKRWGAKIVAVACVGASMHQDITEGMGFADFVTWTRRDPGFVRDIIAYKTEVAVEAVQAAAEAGSKVMWYGDDLAYKSGPMLSPTMIEDLFGEAYRRIAEAAHNGGMKIMFHACGNVLDLLTMIADWGFDGVHALEPTAGVTLAEARRRVGDRLCLCGNVDITHTLVDASREEVFREVKQCIKDGATGGGYIVAATNSHNALNAQNLAWMVEATDKYGHYPINIPDEE